MVRPPEQPEASSDPLNTPATPRDAATVVLLREGAGGPEVFLQRRVAGMAFAGGMTVFPGGGVDRRDADASVAWTGPGPAWWAQRFGCDAETARALVCAAVRETFEESGVLLAGPDDAQVVADTRRYADARRALVHREISLAGLLAEAGLVLRADLLRPWANWLTPEIEPRRYDTRFFLAAMPEGQRADDVNSETSASYWSTPQRALDEAERGETQLMMPTSTTLAEVAACGSTSAALESPRDLHKIMPRLIEVDGQWHPVLPGEPGYEEAQ